MLLVTRTVLLANKVSGVRGAPPKHEWPGKWEESRYHPTGFFASFSWKGYP